MRAASRTVAPASAAFPPHVADEFDVRSLVRGVRDDCLAGHIGLEPANPAAGYLIGFT
jgi:hypothetical protein